jgi:hypothetical protein
MAVFRNSELTYMDDGFTVALADCGKDPNIVDVLCVSLDCHGRQAFDRAP